jgi:hypothetical protein
VIATWSQPHSENERQQRVNDFECCTLYNPRAVLRHLCIIEVLAAFIGNIVCVDTVTPENEHQLSVNTASTEHQQSINRASTHCQQSVNRVSMLLGVASCIIQGHCYGIDPYSTYWQPFCISNNPGFRLKQPGVPDGSDGSDGTSYPLTENYTLPVAQVTGRVA